MNLAPARPASSRRGAAVLVVVALLAILLVSAVAFTILMRVERGASSNYRHMVGARQMLYAGLAQAVSDIDRTVTNECYPPWYEGDNGMGVLDTNRVFTPPAGVIYSVDPHQIRARVLSREAMKYVPVSLQKPIDQAQPEWIQITGSDGVSPVGRYAYVAADVSGLLDANYVSATSRWMGASSAEIQLPGGASALIDLVDSNKFVTKRASDVRYESIKDLVENNNTGGIDAGKLSNFETFSYAPDLLAPDGQPKLYIGGDIGSRLATDSVFSNRLRQILSYPEVLGYNDDNHIVPSRDTNAEVQARVNGFMRSLADYTSTGGFTTNFGYPKVKTSPMIQSVFWAPHVVYTNYMSGTNMTHVFSSVDTFWINVFCPNPADATTGVFHAALKVSSDMRPWASVSGDAQIGPACSRVLLPSTDSPFLVTTNTFSYNKNAGYVWLVTSTSVPPQSVTRPTNYVVNTGTVPNYNAVVKISLIHDPDETEIDRVPADFTTQSGVHLYCTNFTFSPKGFTNWPTGQKCWSETIDPRFNWDPRDKNSLAPALDPKLVIPQWIADNSLRGWTDTSLYPGFQNPPVPGQAALSNNWSVSYFGTDGGQTLMNRVLTNVFLIKNMTANTGALPFLFDNMGVRSNGTTWADTRVSGTNWHNNQMMYSANRPLLSVGELGYIPINYWYTLRLYDHNDQSTFNMLAGNGTNYHRVYDYFTLTPTNAATVPRGLVNINTPHAGPLFAALTNMPLREWQTNALGPCFLSDKVPNVVALITNMTWGANSTFFTSVSDLGKIPWYNVDVLPSSAGATNEFDREAVIRNSAGLFTTRQQIYTIIVRADSFMAKYAWNDMTHGNVLGTAQAVFQVWRDPVPDANGKHHYFVHLFKVLSQ